MSSIFQPFASNLKQFASNVGTGLRQTVVPKVQSALQNLGSNVANVGDLLGLLTIGIPIIIAAFFAFLIVIMVMVILNFENTKYLNTNIIR